MTNKLFSLVAGASLLALAGAANAGQQLSDVQMDRVTAGATSIADAAAVALGEIDADTATQTSTNISTVAPKIAIAESFAQALAAGGIDFQAAAIAHSDSTASLP